MEEKRNEKWGKRTTQDKRKQKIRGEEEIGERGGGDGRRDKQMK